MAREWPWPGDSHVIRSRKMALAYRNLAQEQALRIAGIREMFGRMDTRVLGWEPDEEAVETLRKLLADTTDPVTEMDARFLSWGENWHSDIVVDYEEDDEVDSNTAAQILSVNRDTITRLRVRGRIEGELKKGPGDTRARFYYRVGHLYKFQETTRTRDSHDSDSTDSLHTTGEVTPNEQSGQPV